MSTSGSNTNSSLIYIFQQESVSNLRKAQSLYMTRQQEYEKAKDVAQKAESDALSTSGSNTNSSLIYIFQQESVSNLRKAQSLYMTRQQEYEKAKDVAQKAESDALSTSGSNTNSSLIYIFQQESVSNLRKAQSLYMSRQQEYEKAKDVAQKAESDALSTSGSNTNSSLIYIFQQESVSNLHKAQSLYMTRQQEYEKAKDVAQKAESDALSTSGSDTNSSLIYIFQQESVSNLRKAQSLYMTRQQEYEKAKDVAQKAESDALSTSGSNTNLVAKIDKRKKNEEEALHKVCFNYSKPCLKRPLKNRQNKDVNDKWYLNEGRKYCRMLPLEILQYF